MKSVLDIIETRISGVMGEVSAQTGCAALVKSATDPKFGDYQVNGVMALAKQLRTNPRKLAEQIVAKIDLSDICEPPEIAGPGFINLRLKPEYVGANLLQAGKDTLRLGIQKADKSKTIVVDFSGPNIAKQMHVGHLRSTIIGDCICRLLEFLGHNVVRQNHIGDWGTQFGMVILGLWHICMSEKHREKEPYYQTELEELKANTKDLERLKVICKRIRDRHEQDWQEDCNGENIFKPFLGKLNKRDEDEVWERILLAYQYVNLLEETTTGMGLMLPTIADGKEKTIPYESLTRHVTAMLQKGGEKNKQERDAWEFVRILTLDECSKIYEEIGVTLKDDDVCGESFYKDMLADVVSELKKKGLAVESEGAVCVFPPGFKDKEGKRLPVIVQKSDGAYLYATTDLAALKYRVEKLNADKIIYVTDARQGLHFEMVFAVAKMAGWIRPDTELIHVTFGSVLGEDSKPLKTRSGENVKLKELLDEAVSRARKIVDEKNPDLSDKEKDEIAKAVGIGAVKYADFSNNRTSDYIFSFNKMLAMEGNTAPYMQYAYARVKSINRKGKERGIKVDEETGGLKVISLTEPGELDLAKHLIRYGEAVAAAVADYRPNYLTSFLYDLAQKFSVFYTNCPVLDAGPDKRPTRLLLCDLTARTIRHGLTELLGIEVVEQM